jgi:energy-coupling factor transport system permease protein
MSTATGYFVAGSSWLHRRHPLTKLLGVAFVLLAAFLLPPIVLPVMAVGLILIAWSAGLLRPIVRAMRIPALLLTSILVVNALFFPGATDRLLTVGPLSVTREGLTFGLISAGRVLVAFLATVTFLFTTLADDLLEALVSRGVGHRIAFVILSAVQTVPRMQARAASILQAQQARGLAVTGSFMQRGRALVPLIGPVILGSLVDVRERTFALEARGFGARPGRTAYRVVPDPSFDRVARLVLVLACVGVVAVAVTGIWR